MGTSQQLVESVGLVQSDPVLRRRCPFRSVVLIISLIRYRDEGMNYESCDNMQVLKY